MFKRLLLLKSVPVNREAGLLVLRLILGTSLFLKHGFEKITGYHKVLSEIVGRGHYVMALGPNVSMLCATVADSLFSVLLIVGLATRWSAFFCLVNIFVAWTAVLGAPYFGFGPMQLTGEMMVAYMAGFLCLLFSGGGKYSIDSVLDR